MRAAPRISPLRGPHSRFPVGGGRVPPCARGDISLVLSFGLKQERELMLAQFGERGFACPAPA